MSGSHYHPSDVPRSNGYQSSQSRLVQPLRFVAPRDRYRGINFAHDAVEDDEPYRLDVPLDEFDQRLLEQPYEDRQRAAERGRARLSLAPGPSMFFSATGSEMNRYEMNERCASNGRVMEITQPSTTARLSQFAYNPDQVFDSSSDVQLAPSSSPAFKARQRRAEQQSFGGSQQATEVLPFSGITHHNALQRISETPPFYSQQEVDRQFQKLGPRRPQQYQTGKACDAPVVQGIQLIPTSALPDRLRAVFPFPNFNAVQSKCFDSVFRSDDNFVLASPTGSGKTAILELAVCRAVVTNTTSHCKVVYQAPTKALCSERQRDWERRFNHIGLNCAELTGDSNAGDLRKVQSANIIITTPEKWDSMTRKWKDHERLMKLVKLFLIDEVHILKDDRGAVLEAVVSRMKSIGNGVRFVALSATVPNFQDVAEWLGRNATNPQIPATNEKFGEEFRPVKLKKHVCGYAYNSPNDFGFEKFLDDKLPDIISKYSERKPIMVFCATRNSATSTAKRLAKWWSSSPHRNRVWEAPKRGVTISNKSLRELVASGVAFHHAGLDINDRMQVEQGFLDGNINVICCTSTLAVGVNLPCHLVVIKNTMCFGSRGLEEYSDLEMMQMLGRAGRPQFDDSAVAVIMTRQTKARRYETLVTGQDVLESKLHLNLIDHLNAEISLGTIRNLPSAREWLTGTFLYVRLKQNPAYYKIEGSQSGQSLEEQVDDICFRDIALLREYDLATEEENFRCTEYGHAMTRYYVAFETMKTFMGIPPKASLSEISSKLSALAQASEFSNIRFRQGEKSLYKSLNKSPQIRFPIPVNLDLPAQKVSLIIQSILGAADISWDGDMATHRSQYNTEVMMIFKSTNSLIRCIVDCQKCSGDSVSTIAALMLERSLGSRAWDDSPLQLRQVPGIGTVATRKLVNAQIRSIEDLEATDAQRIETLIGRNPPFGLEILEALKSFPKLRVSLHVQPSSVVKFQDGVKIQLKAEVGFINEKTPTQFAGKSLYVCVLVETSDGRIVHFARISGSKLGTGQSLMFPAELKSTDQSINCYIMCDSIAGSMRCATVKPKIAPSMFTVSKLMEREPLHQSNTSKRRTESLEVQRNQLHPRDDYGDNEIDDNELLNMPLGDLDFDDIDNFSSIADITTRNGALNNDANKKRDIARPVDTFLDDDHEPGPVQLDNGKWACNHRCKDKTACKHMCCREGVEKPPKKVPKKASNDKSASQSTSQISGQKDKKLQTKLQLTTTKRKNSELVEQLDLTQPEKKSKSGSVSKNPEYRRLEHLHQSVQKNKLTPSTSNIFPKRPEKVYDESGRGLSFLHPSATQRHETSSDYGDMHIDEFPPEPPNYGNELSYADYIPDSTSAMAMDYSTKVPVASQQSDTFDDDSLLGDAMIGLADSQHLASMPAFNDSGVRFSEEPTGIDYDYEADIHDDDFPMSINSADLNDIGPNKAGHLESTSYNPPHDVSKYPSEAQPELAHFQPEKAISDPSELGKPRGIEPEGASSLTTNRREISDKSWDFDASIFDILSQPDEVQDNAKLDGSTGDNVKLDCEASDLSKQHDISSSAVKKEEIADDFKGLQPWLFEEFGDIVEIDDD